MDFINPKTYKELYERYLTALLLQRLVKENTDSIMSLLGKDREVAGDSVVDVIYSPTASVSEESFKELLLLNKVNVDWTSVTEESNPPEFQTEANQSVKKPTKKSRTENKSSV